MLEIQKALQNYPLEHIADQLKLKVKEHEKYPLVILNYDQIETPKLHPIAMECRGLILEKDTWRIVARGFSRFFNFGEALEVTSKFDWDDEIECWTKEDGSYINVFWYGDPTAPRPNWRMSTRGSFGMDELMGSGGRWLDIVHHLLPDKFINEAPRNVNFVFELVSPYNKVVRHYGTAELVLLAATIMHKDGTSSELPTAWVDDAADFYGFCRPKSYIVKNYKDVEELLRKKESEDPTFEGFVLKDVNGLRLKVKTTTYMALHRFRGEGDNMYNPKNLVPLILANEGDELLTYFPEVSETWNEMQCKLGAAYGQLHDVWWLCQDFKEQKKFAIYITKENPTPFSGILFKMKQDGTLADENELKRHWRNSSDLILKHVFGRK